MENNAIQKTNNQVAVEKNITDGVLMRVNSMTEKRELVLPHNYSPENALKFAFLDLKQNNLLNTNKDALAAALLNMCVQGLSPQKKQCYFINYGGSVQLMRSYHGDRAVAILAGLAKDIQAYVIYQGDEINITYQEDTNYLQVEHKTNFANWDKPIIGAYAVAILPDGSKRYDLMTIERIRKSWNMSSNKSNNKLQNDFGTEACQRTVTRHLVKTLFNQSNDESLLVNNVIENDYTAPSEDAETKYDESQIIEAQEAQTGTIDPDVDEATGEIQEQPKEEVKTPAEEKKPTKEEIFAKHMTGIQQKIDF